MLEHIFHRAAVVSRVRSGVSAELVEEFAAMLFQRGYRESTIQPYVRAVEHFMSWLAAKRQPRETTTRETVMEFLNVHLQECHCPHPAPRARVNARAALNLLMNMLEERRCNGKSNHTPVQLEIHDFDAHLEQIHGLAVSTRRYRARDARTFLENLFGKGEVDWSRVEAKDLIRFASDRAQHLKPGSAKALASSLRSLLKYASFRGLVDGRLVRALPRIPQWKLTKIPRTMTDEQLKHFLDSFGRDTASGRRDYAMALCMAELGLRASDVAGLELKSVDWRQATLTVGDRKTRRTRLLPLSAVCARAIVDYLVHGRPASQTRKLFVRHSVPVGTELKPEHVRGAMRRAYSRAGLPASWTGTHVLRHTCATRMHQSGVSLKAIADILGHKSLNTTSVYTKANLAMLRGVALPWPEATS